MYGAKAKKHYPDGKSIRLNVADYCHRTELGPRQQLRGGELLGSCIRGYGVIWWRLDLWRVHFLRFLAVKKPALWRAVVRRSLPAPASDTKSQRSCGLLSFQLSRQLVALMLVEGRSQTLIATLS